MPPKTGNPIGSIAVARELGISLRQLYYWIDVLQAVRPAVRPHGRRRFRRFAPKDVAVLRAVKRGLDRGFTLQAAVRAARRL